MKLAAALMCCAGLLGAETTPRFTDPQRRTKLESAFPEVEKIFERFRQQRGIPGLVFGVVIDGELAYVKGIGGRDRGSQAAVTPETVFRIASMTKSFTAASILKLRDAGRLSLEDPVAKWIPEFARFQYATRDTAPIRIRQLLSHGAGFPEDNPWGDQQLGASEETLTRWLERGLPFSTPADTAYEYSNYGFALAGRIVSKASGMTYRDYLEKEVLGPLGMKASTLDAGRAPAGVRAIGYRRTGDEYSEEPPLPHGAFGAMGGLLTNARDLGRWVAYLLSAFPPRDEPERGPLRRSSLREMQHPWRPNSLTAQRSTPDAPLRVTATAYGYGLSVTQDCRLGRVVGHGGGLPGFGSYMMWLPDYGVGMLAMANLTYAGPAAPMMEALDALGKTGGLRPRALPASPVLLTTRDAITRLWNHWDEAEASALAANNLFLDIPAERRRKEIERMQAEVGACRPTGDIEPENLLRGKYRMPCERGSVEVVFTLAPTMPPRVQYLRFGTVKPLDAAMKAAGESLAALIGSPAPERLAALPARLQREIEATHHSYGSCRLGEALEGDGAREARVRLECDRGPLDARYRIEEGGKLVSASFSKPAGVGCVP